MKITLSEAIAIAGRLKSIYSDPGELERTSQAIVLLADALATAEHERDRALSQRDATELPGFETEGS